MFEELAEKMGATLSVSRPLVDAGWMPTSRQVGQSGKTVKPTVYLAFGISGAVQHLAGMKTSGTIIAVNTDPEAAIFNVAHYGARGRPLRRRGRAGEALLAMRDTSDVRRSLALADRLLVRADRRLDVDLRLGRRAARAQVPARPRQLPGRSGRAPRRPYRVDRAHAPLDQAPRRRRGARARADLLRLRRALRRHGDPRRSRTTSRSPFSAATSGEGRSTSATRSSSTSSAPALIVGLVILAVKRGSAGRRASTTGASTASRAASDRSPLPGRRLGLPRLLFFLALTGFLLESFRIAETDPSFEVWSPIGWIVGQGFRAIGVDDETAARRALRATGGCTASSRSRSSRRSRSRRRCT